MNNSNLALSAELKLSAKDESAIRGLAQCMMDGWNALDADQFSAPFTEDADYVVRTGQHIIGRTAIVKGHEHIFSTFYKDSYLDVSVYKVRPLQERIALAHAEAHLNFRLENVEHKGHARYSLVCVNNGGDWQIAAFHNTLIEDFEGNGRYNGR